LRLTDRWARRWREEPEQEAQSSVCDIDGVDAYRCGAEVFHQESGVGDGGLRCAVAVHFTITTLTRSVRT
jgi:hypothetical protein